MTRPTDYLGQGEKFVRVLTRTDFQPLRPPAAPPSPPSERSRRLANRFAEFVGYAYRVGAPHLAQSCDLARDAFLRLEIAERQLGSSRRQAADLRAELGGPPMASGTRGSRTPSPSNPRDRHLANRFAEFVGYAHRVGSPALARVCDLARDALLRLEATERQLEAAMQQIADLQAELEDQFTVPTRTIQSPLVDNERPTAVQSAARGDL
jgi:hypothetical protein